MPHAKHEKRDYLADDPGVRVGDGFLGGKNIRVANRHIVVTTLKKSLKFDSVISSFDVNLTAKLILLGVGRIVYCVNLETNILKAEMGKTGGSAHKGDIKGCCTNIPGTLGATCGEDRRVIVWDLQTWRANKYDGVLTVGSWRAIWEPCTSASLPQIQSDC
ncbi:hypothetical protein HDU91_002620 [Kappamyces sp. JEL0680]|nr:hypothetical protein HDU91_002620 [Kappamyces sp. JEL0680]